MHLEDIPPWEVTKLIQTMMKFTGSIMILFGDNLFKRIIIIVSPHSLPTIIRQFFMGNVIFK